MFGVWHIHAHTSLKYPLILKIQVSCQCSIVDLRYMRRLMLIHLCKFLGRLLWNSRSFLTYVGTSIILKPYDIAVKFPKLLTEFITWGVITPSWFNLPMKNSILSNFVLPGLIISSMFLDHDMKFSSGRHMSILLMSSIHSRKTTNLVSTNY